ncbi:polysaccharide lyase family protein [Allorhizocola rhizosphaerae]|uniref:polysaccharide lyase family protein n=1 Tax=Allorhizocola rhizosphaerae TaxID=1872709 RepID=UPI000E3D382A|nr:polysaccharide lyase family protein [Allorhizocola rhizosphaerae]
MLDRRDFHRLTVGTAAGAIVPLSAPTAAHATGTLEVIETDTDITVDNGPVRLTVSKTQPARATSIIFEGQNLVGNGGRGVYDMNNVREGGALPLPPVQNTHEIRRGDDFVDIVFRFSPSNDSPFRLERHHIIRAGEPGIHLATVFDHPAQLHGFRSDQHRYVFYANRELFTHAWVEEDAIGEPWRAGAARMPTPSELGRGPMVMDATHDLDGVGSAYPRRYYTKYDWAVYMKDHVLHGLYGNGYGVWAVLPNREAFCGGPVRQDLTLHQTSSMPVLLVEPQATHYGSPPVQVAAGQAWSKTYGPYFLYFSRGDDVAQMRAEAMQYAACDAHADFYDRLGLAGWATSRERSNVVGRVRIPDAAHMAGAVAVLSDNGLDFQRAALGYSYWADVNPAGHFAIRNVRPGRYRLTIYRPGVWGEHIRDDVVVEANGTTRLPDVRWEPVRNGRTVFQIGTPNRISAEFRRGSQFRQWGTERFFHGDFPDGVVFTVGQSTAQDWNYLQFQRVAPVSPAFLPAAPTTGVWLFDFGSASRPVADGYTRVANTTLYSTALGYGLDRAVDSRDRGAPDDIRRDFTVGNGYTFQVDVPNGEYHVTVISGDHIAGNNTDLTVQDVPQGRLTSATGEYAIHEMVTRVDDGRLRLRFAQDGRVNAVEVMSTDVPVSALSALSVRGFALEPAFRRRQTEYTLDLPHDVTSLTLTAASVDNAPITIDGAPVASDQPHTVQLTRRHQPIEIVVSHPSAAPFVCRVLAVRQEAPWRIRFDLDQAPLPGQSATLTVGLAAWSLDTARSVPAQPSNLTIRVNEHTALVWTFQPDDARGATYRSGCGGRFYRREFTFDASALRLTGNEITLRINENTPAGLGNNTAAYDAIRLEIN